jgi:hypothetical protein
MLTPCPWDGYTPGTVRFCEERLCATVVEPAGAWSNAGFLVVGLYLFWRSWRNGRLGSPLVLFGLTGTLVSVGSFLFHMTGTFWGEYLDLSTMFLISSLMLTLDVKNLLGMRTKRSIVTYFSLALGSMAVVAVFRTVGIALFITHITVWSLLVIYLGVREKRFRTPYLPTLMSIFLVGYGVWNLDFHHVVCNPQNHVFNGHAFWHLTCATSLLLYYIHQEKIEDRARVASREETRSASLPWTGAEPS